MKTACGDSSTSRRQFFADKSTTLEEKGLCANAEAARRSSKAADATRDIRAIINFEAKSCYSTKYAFLMCDEKIEDLRSKIEDFASARPHAKVSLASAWL